MTNRELAKEHFEQLTVTGREQQFLAFNLPLKWAYARWSQIPKDVQRGYTKQLIKVTK